jgi:hypothetical protein
MTQRHRYQDLIQLFNGLFQDAEQTVLIAGGEEPVYLPKDADSLYHRIIFTRDYYASALHEIAHWCVAGKERRLLVDYGYWYNPDRRNAQQQQLFQSVEAKPQALEWIFSAAADFKFRLSQDNLSGECLQDDTFALSVYQQACHYLTHGMPDRAKQVKQALLGFYTADQDRLLSLSLEDL